MRKITTILLSILIALNSIVVNSSATITTSVTGDKLKTYIGVVILSASGVNLNGSAMKEKTGKELTELLITNNLITFNTTNGSVNYSELITSEGITIPTWDGTFQLANGFLESTMDFINGIPTEPVLGNENYLKPGTKYLLNQGSKNTLFVKFNGRGLSSLYGITNTDINTANNGVNYTGSSSMLQQYDFIWSGSGWNINRTINDSVLENIFGFHSNVDGYSFSVKEGDVKYYTLTTIPYDPSITEGKDRDKLTNNIPVDKPIEIPNVSLDNITAEGVTNWNDCLTDLVSVRVPSKSSTITINANVEPYLEVTLDKTVVDFSITDLSSSSSDINVNIKSNMNYRVESKFSGLRNSDGTSIIDNNDFKLGIGGVDKPLILGEYTVLLDDNVLGNTDTLLNLKLGTGRVIKSDTYSGSLEIRVSQL